MLTALVAALLFCFVINVPIGFALAVASVACVLASGAMPPIVVPQRMIAGADSFPLMAIPFFMLAGTIMERGGVSRRIVNLASSLVGHVTGGLASVSILACTFFAAISGSTPATAAAVGKLTIPEMEERGYAQDYASAVVASAACLGVIIPPSITMVVFGVVANVSIGKLLIGGIIPGLFLSLLLITANYFLTKRKAIPTERRQSWGERWKSFAESFWGLMMPVIILGGIMTGVFTPTESAAIAVVYGLLVSCFIYKELTFKDLVPIFYKASLSSSMIMVLIAAAAPFGWLLTILQVPQHTSQAMLSLTTNWAILYVLMLICYLILGCFMETGAIILLVVPIFAPIAQQVGIDLVQFGVVTVISLAIGMATPPVGISLFATCGVSGVSIEKLSKQVIPFLAVLIGGMLFLAFVPIMSTFLPDILF
ncbi:MAG: TRAP transporter large permease [Candidatus Accumulibacter sp.]|jgi:C4-dicarboxylate transporter DctM subunit|nr:TRAP transporter large permease [Accumulibacter sp.]